MAKLPKKSTMKDTINRVKRYAYLAYQNKKYTTNNWASLEKELSKLEKALNLYGT